MVSRRIVAIIQARMGSTRLPGKVLKEIGGRPMIFYVIQRARHISGVDEVVVATSTNEAEGPLVDYVSSLPGVGIFRGPEDDVLKRYYEAAVAYSADVIMRITGDCPLLCPRISQRVLEAYLACEPACDYATNTKPRTYPRGLDTSVMGIDTLERVRNEASSPAHREHVTSYIWSNPDRFEWVNVADDHDRHHHRWTVDTADDLRLIRRIYDAVGTPVPPAGYDEILAALRAHPRWQSINQGVRQKRIDE